VPRPEKCYRERFRPDLEPSLLRRGVGVGVGVCVCVWGGGLGLTGTATIRARPAPGSHRADPPPPLPKTQTHTHSTLRLLYMEASSVGGTSAPPFTPRFILMNASRLILCFTAGLCRSVLSMMRAKART
jgi:hypothetical protein